MTTLSLGEATKKMMKVYRQIEKDAKSHERAAK